MNRHAPTLSVVAASLLAVLLLAACGGGVSAPVATRAPGPTTAAPSGDSDLPAVNVLDVATGAEVNVASLSPSEKPLLIWFYAPH